MGSSSRGKHGPQKIHWITGEETCKWDGKKKYVVKIIICKRLQKQTRVYIYSAEVSMCCTATGRRWWTEEMWLCCAEDYLVVWRKKCRQNVQHTYSTYTHVCVCLPGGRFFFRLARLSPICTKRKPPSSDSSVCLYWQIILLLFRPFEVIYLDATQRCTGVSHWVYVVLCGHFY